jgi:hypothetical protein
MQILHLKKLYLPALSLVAIIFLLLVLISISTYRNLDREKTRALHFLNRQGVMLLRSIEASARTGSRKRLKTMKLHMYTLLMVMDKFSTTRIHQKKARVLSGIRI